LTSQPEGANRPYNAQEGESSTMSDDLQTTIMTWNVAGLKDKKKLNAVISNDSP